ALGSRSSLHAWSGRRTSADSGVRPFVGRRRIVRTRYGAAPGASIQCVARVRRQLVQFNGENKGLRDSRSLPGLVPTPGFNARPLHRPSSPSHPQGVIDPARAALARAKTSGEAERVPLFSGPPGSSAASQMTAFTAELQKYAGRIFHDYATLHDFSVREYPTFWRCLLDWTRATIDWHGSAEPACVGDDCEHARFFPQLQLNYADNLLNLSVAAASAPALTACHADGQRVRWTRGELREHVARLAQALAALGLREGDRVVGVMRNDDRAVIAALAVTALGATLSTAAPEMGVEALLDRFAPLAPRLLLAHVQPRAFDSGISLAANAAELAAALPSLQ